MFVKKEITLFLFLHFVTNDAINILGLATYDGNSHWLVMKSVFQALQEAGHHVTVVTPHFGTPETNFTFVDLSKVIPPKQNSFTYDFLIQDYKNPLRVLHIIPNLSLSQCDKSHASQEVQELLKGDRKFDLVITETFGADCDAVFAHLLDVPLISVITSVYLPWANARVGGTENPSYLSHVLLPYSNRMSFFQRMFNVFYFLYTSAVTTYYNALTTELNKKHFGEVPAIEDVLRRTSLVFVNSHFTFDVPRPFPPNVIEIGGIHLPPVKPLSKDLRTFLDKSKNGVIYFSLGSIIRASTLPLKTITAIKQAFAELEYDVLWKFEDESTAVSPNVIIRNWFPQRDILAHKNLKLAIMHGGLMGIFEAIDVGIPVLGIPIFFDQPRNIANLVTKGMALRLDIDKITKNNFLSSIRKLLHDKRYTERAMQLRVTFHDRLVKPKDSVVYWTEYVIKHKGAYHLRSAAVDLYWFQTLLLDILVFFFLLSFIILYLLKKITKLLLRIFKTNSLKTTLLKTGMQKNGVFKNGVRTKQN